MQKEIESLEPSSDASRIIKLYMNSAFPKDDRFLNLIYTLGLIRLCASQEQALPLHRNGTGKVYKHADRRADETNYHLFMWLDKATTDPDVRQSLAHVKKIHDALGKKWTMRNDAFIHALATFTLLVDRFYTQILDLKTLPNKHKEAMLKQWTEIGEGLGISNIPNTWENMENFLISYEFSNKVQYSIEGREVAESLIEQFNNRWLPKNLHRQGRWLIISLLEDHIVDALHFSQPPKFYKFISRKSLASGLRLKYYVLPDPKETFNFYEVVSNSPKSALL